MSEECKVPAEVETALTIGKDIVAHLNSNAQGDQPLWDKHWSSKIVSVEADGMTHEGFEQLKAKHAEWFGKMTVHSVKAEGPWAMGDKVAVKISLDCEANDGSMPRMQMDELALYTIEGGKVVREEFLMPSMG